MWEGKRMKTVIYKGDEYTVEDEMIFNGEKWLLLCGIGFVRKNECLNGFEKMYFKLFKKLYVR
jgi:hypothetical protein